MAAAPDRPPRWPAAVRRFAGRLALVALPLGAAWLLARVGFAPLGAALAGAVVLAASLAVGLSSIRRLLSGTSGIAGVAATVVDEAVRMRSTLVLLVLLIGLVPALPLLVDPGERLAYRVQFLIAWTLGGAGLLLGLLTAFLACGSVCGDIDSGRIHMTLAKPLRRWEYLAGKWLGIVLYDLLLVALAGAGSYTLVRLLALGPAADDADRIAVDRQVLTARRGILPGPDRPEEYAAAIAAAIERLEADDPGSLGPDREVTRRRLRAEEDRRWHTVTPDMETTFVFRGLGEVQAGRTVQLQLEPRATNVDVDLADVRFAVWLNGRPWPIENGVQGDFTLASRARHVLELPSELLAGSPDLRIRIANRNLVPPGETRPTAITFPPGEGMTLYVTAGGFEANFLRGLLILWAKLALVAAVGVAAGAMFDLPSAILTTLVVYFTALGSDFLRDALGSTNVVAESAWQQAAARMSFAAEFLRAGRFAEAFRMLLGFVTDGLLAAVPSFATDQAVPRLAGGVAIPARDVVSRLAILGVVYPLLFGTVGWLVFDRRDLVRSSS